MLAEASKGFGDISNVQDGGTWYFEIVADF